MVIKTLSTSNPFADYGNIVTADRFIGRKKYLESIYSRVLGISYGNIAIMGLPRVGKSSLAWNALIRQRTELSTKNILVERLNIGSICNSKQFFTRMMDKTLGLVRELSFSIYDPLLQARNSFDLKGNETELEYFFSLIKQNGFRVIYILDEFDNISKIFHTQEFQLLRELSISPETKVCLITLSRRTIQELEPDEGAVSNFYGVFSELHLRPFDENDIDAYWHRTKRCGLELSPSYCDSVRYFVGEHPYWLDMVNYYIFNELQRTDKSAIQLLTEIESEMRKTLWSNYDDIIRLMEKENLKSQFIQTVIGPAISISQMGIERLSKYGLIKDVPAKEKYSDQYESLFESGMIKSSDLSYTSLSQHLNDYLRQNENEYDIWPLWTNVEHDIRGVIKMNLIERYGVNWVDNFELQNPEKVRYIKSMKELKLKSWKNFGNLASDHLVDYTLPYHMWLCFIDSDWPWFQKILGGTESEWKEKFFLLNKIRNPIAHSNREFVIKDEQIRAKLICEQISEKIRHWIKNIKK